MLTVVEFCSSVTVGAIFSKARSNLLICHCLSEQQLFQWLEAQLTITHQCRINLSCHAICTNVVLTNHQCVTVVSSMNHIVDIQSEDGLPLLHEAESDAVKWLESIATTAFVKWNENPLPPERDPSVSLRLQHSKVYPIPLVRTKWYCSFLNYFILCL